MVRTRARKDDVTKSPQKTQTKRSNKKKINPKDDPKLKNCRVSINRLEVSEYLQQKSSASDKIEKKQVPDEVRSSRGRSKVAVETVQSAAKGLKRKAEKVAEDPAKIPKKSTRGRKVEAAGQETQNAEEKKTEEAQTSEVKTVAPVVATRSTRAKPILGHVETKIADKKVESKKLPQRKAKVESKSRTKKAEAVETTEKAVEPETTERVARRGRQTKSQDPVKEVAKTRKCSVKVVKITAKEVHEALNQSSSKSHKDDQKLNGVLKPVVVLSKTDLSEKKKAVKSEAKVTQTRSTRGNSKKAADKSPEPVKKLLPTIPEVSPPPKIIIDVSDENDNADPYNFEMSQSVEGNKKEKKKPKKRGAAKSKPGSNMELLIKKQKLEVVANSLSAQSNPTRYKNDCSDLIKQMNVAAPSINKVIVEDERPRDFLKKRPNSSPIQITQKLIPLKQVRSDPNQIHSKVWHSPPQPSTSAKSLPRSIESIANEVSQRFVSSSPPIQSAFALKMAALHTQASTTPLRVNNNLPSTFYMSLSENCTPSFSSDLIEKGTLDNSPGPSKSSKKSKLSTSPKKSLPLDDSNAENLAPSGCPTSPVKQKPQTSRSPLKALSVSKFQGGEMSSFMVVNETAEKSRVVKSPDMLELCEKTDTRDTFGFDELLENSPYQASTSAAAAAYNTQGYHDKMKCIQEYLPSKNNKNRDKDLFPTSPLKRSEVYKESIDKRPQDIRQFMSASTPLAKTQQTAKNAFEEVSAILEDVETNDDTTIDETNGSHLFDYQSEPPAEPLHRSYSKKTKIPQFLKNVEVESDDEAPVKKSPSKNKRKKAKVEESAEFKKFIHEKSREFEEVEDFEVIIE